MLIQLHGLTGGDVVDHDAVLNRINNHVRSLLSLNTQQLHDQRHADVAAVLGLLEVAGTGVVVHRDGDLIDAGQRMQDSQILLGAFPASPG